MSREVREQTVLYQSRPTTVPQHKEQAKQIGALGEAIRNLTQTLHETAYDEWLFAVHPLVKRMNDLSFNFERTLNDRINQVKIEREQQPQLLQREVPREMTR